MTQRTLDLDDRGRRRQLRRIDQHLSVLARHLHRHHIHDCPAGCDRWLLLEQINVWLDARLREMP